MSASFKQDWQCWEPRVLPGHWCEARCDRPSFQIWVMHFGVSRPQVVKTGDRSVPVTCETEVINHIIIIISPFFFPCKLWLTAGVVQERKVKPEGPPHGRAIRGGIIGPTCSSLLCSNLLAFRMRCLIKIGSHQKPKWAPPLAVIVSTSF